MRRPAIMLLLLLLAAACLFSASAEEAAPIIRVQLRRLNLTDRMDLILDGDYSLTGEHLSASLESGASCIVQIRDGHLILFCDKVRMDAGSFLTFTRHSGSGFRLTRDGNLYAGDLKLTVNGGILEPVLHISVEDYLRGVLPYEMSNDFPLEALKAQAVCARTYALAHVRTDRSWDVVDTTNDQVFRGYSGENPRCDQAILETAGIVGMWKNRLASCYYAASNGGQTDLESHAWLGMEDSGLYIITDDPYDLANPESLVKSVTLSRNGHDLPEFFVQAVYERFMDTLVQMGYDPRRESFRIDALTGLSLTGATLGEEHHYRSELVVTFSFSGRPLLTGADDELLLFSTPSPDADAESMYGPMTACPQAAQVILPLFPDLADQFSLQFPGTDYELVTLVDTGTAFRLESRRFGHGVGMSQRGAQYMAAHEHWTFDQILGFYYPGMELRIAPSGQALLPAMNRYLAGTPAPSASPTPRPTLMPVTLPLPANAWLASVEHIAEDSSLNLRSEPSMASDILMRLYPHQRLQVLETSEDGQWAHVRTDSMEGYVLVSFLEKVGP